MKSKWKTVTMKMTNLTYQFPLDHEGLDVVDGMNVVHGVNHNFADLKQNR